VGTSKERTASAADEPAENDDSPPDARGASGSGGSEPEHSGLRCRVKISSVDGILAVIPHLLGFNPADSLVMLGVGGPHARIRLTFRYDLPDPLHQALAVDIAAHAATVLRRQDLMKTVAVGYGSSEVVETMMAVLVPALRDAGIDVQDVIRVADGRYWSLACADADCCPPRGVPFDPRAHPASAALAEAGLPVRADRAALAATLASEPDAAEPMRAAMARARTRTGQLVDLSAVAAGEDPFQPVADAGRRAVKQAVARYRQGDRITADDEIAWLGVVLGDLRVRDDAWARMDPEYNDAHRRLWTDLVRRLPADLAAAPAALLAFTAWQGGDGALASIAIERALAADPDYSMALLIAEALHAGLPPSAARLPMTPKQVAASYARRRRERAEKLRRVAEASRRPEARRGGRPGGQRRTDSGRPGSGGPGSGGAGSGGAGSGGPVSGAGPGDPR
jgi:Domain of unknown function (DUF4192)